MKLVTAVEQVAKEASAANMAATHQLLPEQPAAGLACEGFGLSGDSNAGG